MSLGRWSSAELGRLPACRHIFTAKQSVPSPSHDVKADSQDPQDANDDCSRKDRADDEGPPAPECEELVCDSPVRHVCTVGENADS
jgi:hypothetical protein